VLQFGQLISVAILDSENTTLLRGKANTQYDLATQLTSADRICPGGFPALLPAIHEMLDESAGKLHSINQEHRRRHSMIHRNLTYPRSSFPRSSPSGRPLSLLAAVLLVLASRALVADAAAQDSATVLERIGVNRGICMLVGDAPSGFAVQLARGSQLTIYVQSANFEQVLAARQVADAAGLLGSRIFITEGGYARLHLADDIADAVIVTESAAGAAGVSKEELLRVLRPGGKVLLDGAELTKASPPGTDEWTHPYHSADNNPQSADIVARRPYLTHFMAEPWYCPLPQISVVSNGRIFKAFGNRSSARPQEDLLNKLFAMSAYNGTILWRRDLSPDFMIHRNTMIASPDTLYLADDKSCKLIDAATGEIRDEIIAPAELSDGPVWKWMALEGGVLYALVGEKETSDQPLRGDRLRGAGWPWWSINNYTFGFGRTLLAIDPATKKVLWHHREQERIDSRALCMKNDRIYFYSDQKFLACLDRATGNVVWKSSEPDLLEAIGANGRAQHWMLGFASTAYMKAGDDALFFAGPQRERIVGASTKDGRLLWKRDGGNVQLVLRSDGLYALGEGRVNSVASSFKLDPLTGEVLATFPSRDRCTRATGCVDSIFTRGGNGGSTAVFDVTSSEPKMGVVSPMRPACQDGVVVSHGLLFWGPWMCRCDMAQLGVISLGPGGSFDYLAQATDAERLEGAAADAGDVEPFEVSAADWPAYRKDNARSTYTELTVPDQVRQQWQFSPVSRVVATAPVTAGGLVFVSGSDGVVRVLDAADGTPRWTAYTGGQVKYPPAIADGRVYVGSGDGWVYCFDAATGKRQWRFRAAPIERAIPLYGLISSTWPVGSGVLVDNGVVYAAAGISNFDGTHVYALDAVTGKIRWQNNTSGNEDPETPEGGVSVQGPLLLHKGAIYMASGNMPPLSSYAVADGKFAPAPGGRGKDLFIRRNQVNATGFPLYWRTEDDHFLSPMELETPAGNIAVATAQLALLAEQQPADPKEKPKAHWISAPFQEIAAVVVTKNAVLVTGLDRTTVEGKEVLVSGLCALNLSDGKQMWKHPLPAAPVAWGLAVDRDSRIIATLTDGRVLGFGGL
jgi:outer membrane protein assembly factor BamB